LNVTGDGHVPLSDELYDGNRADVTTHIPNWEQLRALLDREDFIDVADSKLCSYENLCTIAGNGGRFITLVPRNVREVKNFLASVRAGEAVKKAVPGARAYLGVTIHEDRTSELVQVGRGRPGPNTRYEEKESVSYRLEWARDEDEIARARRSDGLFPLVDNTSLEPLEVLRT
jgi:hypothetical protein